MVSPAQNDQGSLNFSICNTEVREDIATVTKIEWLPSIGFCTLSSLELPLIFFCIALF